MYVCAGAELVAGFEEVNPDAGDDVVLVVAAKVDIPDVCTTV
jgi:hypothetical protein